MDANIKEQKPGKPESSDKDNSGKGWRDKIEEDKKKNQKERIESDCKKTWQDKLNEDISNLDKLFGGVNQIVDEYEKDYPKFLRSKDCIKKDYERWQQEIDKEIPKDDNGREKIDNKKKEVDEEIKKLEDCIESLKGKLPEYPDIDCAKVDEPPRVHVDCSEVLKGGDALTDLESAEKKLNCAIKNDKEKDSKYNKWKDRRKTTDDQFKKLAELQAKIEKEENKYKKYFFITELEKSLKLDEIENIKTPKELKSVLIAALDNLLGAKKDLRKKEYVKCVVIKTLEATKKYLDDAMKNRDANVLGIINEM